MVAEFVAAKIFLKNRFSGCRVMTILPLTLWSAFVSITKNEHDETTNTERMERRDCLIAL